MQAGTGYEHLGPLLAEFTTLEPAHPRYAGLRDELILGYLPVTAHLARRYTRLGQPVEDLQQVATVGLVNALDRFDPARGTEFLSYLIPTATGEILRYLRDFSWTIRIPRRLSDLQAAVNRAIGPMSQDLGRAPRSGEIAGYLGVSRGDVIEARSAGHARHLVSLDDGQGETAASWGAVVGCVDAALGLVEDRQDLRAVVARLPERERRILMLRFVACRTQSQIGATVGLSQMQVSRLLAASLTTLRAALRAPPPPPTPLSPVRRAADPCRGAGRS